MSARFFLLILALFAPLADLQAGLSFVVTGNTARVAISGVGGDLTGDVTIPSTYQGVPVTSIGENAFTYCTQLTSITIPSSVTSIGKLAFSNCWGLKSITIPSSVTSIGDEAFADCTQLTSITIPSSITSIGKYIFRGCSGLTSITIPSSVTSIGNGAFSGCSGLTSITIPSSVTSIGNGAFIGCDGLVAFSVDSSHASYASFNGALFNKSLTTLICWPPAKEGSSGEIPSSVTSIWDGALYGCSGLTSITIPSSVTSIGANAFTYCNQLTSITIPSGVTTIGANAFAFCSGLTSITIPSSVTSIGDFTFAFCSGLTSITIPSGVPTIGYHTFYACSGLTNITIPSSVTSIGANAFTYCSGLTSITIPGGVTTIGANAFAYCSGLTSITIPSSVTSIGDFAFAYCSGLTSITIPNSITNIGYGALSNLAALMIASQPVPLTINAGSLASFRVIATESEPLTYQWLKNGTNIVSGGRSAVFTIASAQTTDSGSYSVVVSNSAGTRTITSESAILTVNKAPQSIGAFAAIVNKTFGDPAFTIVLPAATSGLPVSVTVKSGPATINGGTVTVTEPGTVVLSATQAGNVTYLAATEVTTSFVVNKAPQSVDAFAVIGNKSFGDAAFIIAPPAATSGLPVSVAVKSGPATINGNTVTLTGADSVVLSATQAGNANYLAATEVTTSFVVNKAPQSIDAFALIGNKTFGDAAFTIVPPAATSGLPVSVAVKSGPATINGNTVTLTGAGSVMLSANQAGNGNYTASTEVTTSFNVGKRSQSIGNFGSIPSKSYGDAPFAVTVPAATSGLTVLLSVKSGPATVSGNTVTITGVGTVVLAANQIGDTNYNAAPEVTVSVTVSDTAKPTLTLPANMTAPATNASGAVVAYPAATATDNVTANPVITYSKASGTLFPRGTTTVIVTARDDAGNVSSGTFTVTVSDLTAPVLTLPPNVTVSTTSASGATVMYSAASATDNVTASPVITYSQASGTVFPPGTTPVIVTAGDVAANVSSGSFTVTVLPNIGDVTFAQRIDNSMFVDVYYTLWGGSANVAFAVSYDGGTAFNSVSSVTGDVGAMISAGTGKHIVWNAGPDYPSSSSSNVKMRVTALLNGVDGTFAPIPAGTYSIGNATGDPDIANATTTDVTLSGYYMSVNDTTKAQWDTVRAWALLRGYTDLAAGAGKASNHPVQTVSWYDAVKWANAASEKEGLTPCYKIGDAVYRMGSSNSVTCDWAASGYRLPTEAEWEVAARGGLIGKRFPLGDTITHSQANYNSSASLSYDISPTRGYHPTYATGGTPYTSPVGSFAANGYGLNDMAGNVFQWCWDWYGGYASGSDPRGAVSGTVRVLRGGYCLNVSGFARCAQRNSDDPGYADFRCGFRLARARPMGVSRGTVSIVGSVDTVTRVPSITAQPSPVTVAVGSLASFSVTATGPAPLTYQWLKNGTSIASGGKGPSFTIASVQATDAGNYRVVVSNAAGSVTSVSASLVVNKAEPTVFTWPSASSISAGQTLLSSKLTGGSASVPGSFAFTSPSTVPGFGTASQSVTFTPTDSSKYASLSASVNVTVNAVALPVITSSLTSSGTAGSVFSYQITATNNPTSYGASELPAGLSVNSNTGIISGTLMTAGQFPIRITASDSNSTSLGSATLVLTVSPFVASWSNFAGSYEGLLELDAESAPDDNAVYRGAFSLTFTKAGLASGRVLYNEATALDGATGRLYSPVTRTFAGALTPSAASPTLYQKVIKLGASASVVRQELTLEVSFATTPPTLNVTVKDSASPVIGEDAWVSHSLSCARSIAKLPAAATVNGETVDYSKAAGHYTLAAADLDLAGENDAYVLAQVLSTGKVVWTSRIKGALGTGSAGLRVTSNGLRAAFYEGRVSSSPSLFKSISLLGSLNFVSDSTSGNWSSNFGSDRLPGKVEKQASNVSKSKGKLAFTEGQDSTGVIPLDFSKQDGMRWGNATVTTVPAFLSGGTPDSSTFTLSTQDPLSDANGNPASYSWNVTIAASGKVQATSISDDAGVLSPKLTLTLDRQRGEFTGYYTSSISGKSVRRNIYGCGLMSQSDDTLRAWGWVEATVLSKLYTGEWKLCPPQ